MDERAEGFWWVRRVGQTQRGGTYSGRWGPGLVRERGGALVGRDVELWWDGRALVEDDGLEWGPYLGIAPPGGSQPVPPTDR